MRLLNVDTLQVENFPFDPPPYAALSHRWEALEENEVSFQDILQLATLPSVKDKRGFAKISGCCEQAKKHCLGYVWIDTCCIDKTNNTELHEAINSMWNWYQECARCFVYMSDVRSDQDPDADDSDFSRSQWFKRGWTLQELLAPGKVTFFAQDWRRIGKIARRRIRKRVSRITGIPENVLRDGETSSYSVARRMFWASQRATKKIEDRAYSLMGIFGITMPIIYGGGENMFVRFQLEIMKKSVDHTIFAWTVKGASPTETTGLLTSAPTYFVDVDEIPYESFVNTSSDIINSDSPHQVYYVDTNLGIHITLPMKRVDGNDNLYLAMLRCSLPGKPHEPLCVYLQPVPGFGNQWVRTRIGELIPAPRDGELFTNIPIFAKRDASFFDTPKRRRALSIDSSMSATRDSIAYPCAGESIRRSLSTNAAKNPVIPESTSSDIPSTSPSNDTQDYSRNIRPRRNRWNYDRRKNTLTTLPPPPASSSTLGVATSPPTTPKIATSNNTSPADSTRSTPQSKKPTLPKVPRKDVPSPASIALSISAPSQLTTDHRESSTESQRSSRPKSVPRNLEALEGPVTKIWYSKKYAKAHPDRPQFWEKGHKYSRSLSPSVIKDGDGSSSAWSMRAQSSDRPSNPDKDRARSKGPEGDNMMVADPHSPKERPKAVPVPHRERSTPVGSSRKEPSQPSGSNPQGEQPAKPRHRGRKWSQKPVGSPVPSASPPRRLPPPVIIVTLDEDVSPPKLPDQPVVPPSSTSESSYSISSSSTPTTPPATPFPLSQNADQPSRANTPLSNLTDSNPSSVDDEKFVSVIVRSTSHSPTTSSQRSRSNSDGGSLMRKFTGIFHRSN